MTEKFELINIIETLNDISMELRYEAGTSHGNIKLLEVSEKVGESIILLYRLIKEDYK